MAQRALRTVCIHSVFISVEASAWLGLCVCLLARTCACRRTCTLCVGCAACARIPHIGSRGRKVREGTERLADGVRRSLQRAHARRNMQRTTCIAIDQRVTVSDALQSIGYSVRHSRQHSNATQHAQQCSEMRFTGDIRSICHYCCCEQLGCCVSTA